MAGAEMKINIDGSAVAKMVRSPGGPVGLFLLRAGERVEAKARELAPGKGPMKNGIKAKLGLSGLQLAVTVTSSHPATMYVINGTKPHEIRPRVKSVLAFTVNGQRVFAKVVMHPGTRPNPFLQKALEASRF